ncbi:MULTISPECIES: hypothetical protein [unclassified Microcoleus]|uniref:hypothetical protein n=1 Tax=unclassified Microcoleus TaxID=2642155 RepID=UPI002FD32D6D
MDSKLASDVVKSDRIFGSNSIYFVGSVLAPGFFSQQLAQNISQQFAGFAGGKFGSVCDRCGGDFMQLKMFVLSGAAVALWLVPLVSLDKKITWHKAIQGLSLGGAVACAIGAGNIARRLAEENEIEEIKTRAIKADVVDEISTSVYLSQAQRQQEAEAILAPPNAEMEETRERLEAIYKAKNEEAEVAITTTTDASLELAKSLYGEVVAAREAGKANTWIIENILKMKGRKFAEGKAKLQELLSKFEE